MGVIHHSISYIFGGAFCFDQTTKTLEWLFMVFTKAMNGKHLKVVLTDGDSAIAAIVSLVWPKAHHRLGKDSTKINDAFMHYVIEIGDVECSCKKFELQGILCFHALKTLNRKNIQELLERYILGKWTKKLKMKLMKISPRIPSYDGHKPPTFPLLASV
ncbi:FAR1-RELATED SEQUENCE 9 protein [Nymphaea thermarum]|nr:FAR1-RELATED SEQUENCE 9 protein [Nymphaea thermarum]